MHQCALRHTDDPRPRCCVCAGSAPSKQALTAWSGETLCRKSVSAARSPFWTQPLALLDAARSPFWTQPLTRTGRQLDNPPGSKRLPAVDGRDEVQPIAPSQWAATRARARPAEPPSASPPTQSRSCHCPPHTSLRENMCATQKGGHEV
jgi:anti-sigma factor ChrR (cupin superfamily)